MDSEPTDSGSSFAQSAQAQAIARILSSQSLAKSERARALLSYLYDKHRSGEADQVKGFTIAMDVFGRDENFDPNNDALVRVHMGRLRDLLASYYRGEGARDTVRIVVPKGRYILQFNAQEAALTDAKAMALGASAQSQSSETVPVGAEAGATLAGSGARQLKIAAALATLAIFAVLLFFAIPNLISPDEPGASPDTIARADGEPPTTSSVLRNLHGVSGVQFLPHLTFAHSKGAVYLESGRDRFALQLRASLARFDTIQLIANGPIERIEAPRDVGRSYYTLLVSEIEPGVEVPNVASQTATHRLELRHPNTGDILWTQFVARPRSQTSAAPEAEPEVEPGAGENSAPEGFDPELIAVASRVAAMDGLLISHFVGTAGANRLFDCLSLVAPVVQDLPPDSAEAAVTCLGRLIAAGNRLPITHAFLALAIMDGARSGSASTAAGLIQVDSIAEEAIEVLQQGLRTTPESAALLAVQAHAQLFQTGDHAAAIGLSFAAIERSDASWTIWASHARMLALAGRYDEANFVIDALSEETGRLAPNWAFTRFLTSLASGDDRAIQNSAAQLGGVSNPFYYSARIVAEHRRSDFLKRDEMVRRLQQTYPQFYANPPIFIRSMRLTSDLQEEFLLNLRRAGVYRLG
ncbi:MAG: hypothetical protein AAF141_00955 [Pseudomonadota bacterium]